MLLPNSYKLANAIQDYLVAMAASIESLEGALGLDDVLRWKSEGHKQAGDVSGIEYEFHGVGLYIKSQPDDVEIEIEFGPGGKLGGFDSWRLWQWVKVKPGRYPGLSSHQDVRDALEEMRSTGEVVPMNGSALLRLARTNH